MNATRLATALVVVFGAIAALLVLLGLTVTPVALLVAMPFAVAAYLLRGEAMRAAAYDRAEFRRRATAAVGDHAAEQRQGRTTEGARYRDPRSDAGSRGADPFGGARRTRTGAGGASRGRRRASTGWSGGTTTSTGGRLSEAEARDLLDVPADADAAAVRSAYRERAKELHPDQGGDEEGFRELTRAYDLLRE